MTPITAALRELAAKATPVTDDCEDDPKHLHLALSPDTLNLLLDVVDSAVAFCTDWAGDPDFGPATDRLVEAIAALEADHAV